MVGIAAATIYILTAESSASFWDCGEFISCANKLEVGHPPGAPTFLLIARMAAIFSFGNVTSVALHMNYLISIFCGCAVMFAFWIITYMARKFFIKDKEMSRADIYAVLGAGIVGAMSYTFCDSYWFSAVETVVWAMACFFTMAIFWAATKWDRETNVRNSLPLDHPHRFSDWFVHWRSPFEFAGYTGYGFSLLF